MDDLFLLLFFVSFLCLIIGLIRPTVFSHIIKGTITRKKIGLIFGIAIFTFFVLFGMSTDTSDRKVTSQTSNTTNTQTPQISPEKEVVAIEDTSKPHAVSVTKTKADNNTKAVTQTEVVTVQEEQNMVITIPAEYKSALNKASSYANVMHMSKKGVYDQLVSEYGEKFSAVAAQYAIDNVKADWNANALAKAKTYQDKMNMSPAAVHDQLTSDYGEKFTQVEADYAIQHLND